MEDLELRASRPPGRRVSGLVARLDRVLYPSLRDHWDDDLFRERVLARLLPASRLLDLGAGAGRLPQMNFRGSAAFVAGYDVDEAVRENPFLDEAHVGDGETLPFADASFDLVVSDNVFEHVARPEAVFAEVARVLRRGGWFLMKTPNRWHYVTLLARATPFWFHRLIGRLRGRPAEHTFPTLYRANSPGRVRALAAGAGLRVESIEMIEGRPEYLRLTAPTYLAGWLYERIVNATPRLARFRVVLLASLRKP
jgi:SAM-dependent methyltransferase